MKNQGSKGKSKFQIYIPSIFDTQTVHLFKTFRLLLIVNQTYPHSFAGCSRIPATEMHKN